MLPAQLLVAAQWPRPYRWGSNLISDLGSTMCGIADAGARVERYVCSPWFVLANAATIVSGLLLALGALLLWSFWPRRRSGRAASVFLMLGGLGVVGVGLVPWDTDPELHNLLALVQAPLQWVGMAFLACATWNTSVPRLVPRVTVAAGIVSVVGFALFLGVVAGEAPLGLGLGVSERIAFDTLTIWSVIVGASLLVASYRRDAVPTAR